MSSWIWTWISCNLSNFEKTFHNSQNILVITRPLLLPAGWFSWFSWFWRCRCRFSSRSLFLFSQRSLFFFFRLEEYLTDVIWTGTAPWTATANGTTFSGAIAGCTVIDTDPVFPVTNFYHNLYYVIHKKQCVQLQTGI